MRTPVLPVTGSRWNLTYPYGNSIYAAVLSQSWADTKEDLPQVTLQAGSPQRGSDPVLGEIWSTAKADLTKRGFQAPARGADLQCVRIHVFGCRLLAERTGTAAGCGRWNASAEPSKREHREVVFGLVSCSWKAARSLYLERKLAVVYHNRSVTERDWFISCGDSLRKVKHTLVGWGGTRRAAPTALSWNKKKKLLFLDSPSLCLYHFLFWLLSHFRHMMTSSSSLSLISLFFFHNSNRMATVTTNQTKYSICPCGERNLLLLFLLRFILNT